MYYGIDIGGTKIELAAFNEKLEKLYTERVPTTTNRLSRLVTCDQNASRTCGCPLW